jgi:NAD(P)H-dependent FMN reductase
VTYTVGYMIGSLSAVSVNRILARALVRLAPVKEAIAGVDAMLCLNSGTRFGRHPDTEGNQHRAAYRVECAAHP